MIRRLLLIALVWLAPLPALAAVSFSACGTLKVASTQSAGTNQDATGLTVSANANRALVAQIAFSNTALTGVSVNWDATGTPQAMAIVTNANQTNGAAGRAVLYGLVAPTSGAKTLRVTWSGGGTSDIYLIACEFDGVDQTGGATSFANGASVTGSSSGTFNTSALSITSSTSDMAVAVWSTTASWNSQNQTQTFLNNTATNISGLGSRVTTPAASVSFTGNGTSTPVAPYVGVGADLVAAGAAASCVPTLALMGVGC